MKKILLLPLLALPLGACDWVGKALDTGREYGGKGVAAAAEVECSLSFAERAENLEAINNALAARNLPPQPALDCDGDGAPDF